MRKFSWKLASQALWQLRVRGRPFVLSHAVTTRCNLKCSFCRYWKNPGPEMGRDEICDMLRDARSFGIGAYNAWAAEPLMRDDLPQILACARSLGMTTSLVTNGLLLKRRLPELAGLDYLTVSLDGLECYRELRGADPKTVVDAICAAKEAVPEILINCVISQRNLDELPRLVELARSLGVWVSFEPMHKENGIDDLAWQKFSICDESAYKEAIDRLIRLKESGAPIINSLTYLKMVRGKRPTFRCRASDIILHVTAEGAVHCCRAQDQPLGHVSQGLARVWERSKIDRKRISRQCPGCLFFGYAENSMLFDMVPEVLAHYEWM
ncbi:MAG TPA: radical SAM protein [Methanotrichaceae archaeon]|nr:radical SAM protein [Methanotrichaceae archaeon]